MERRLESLVESLATAAPDGPAAVVITGTDVDDQPLTDTITLTDGGNATDVGAKAFKTVTSILYPRRQTASKLHTLRETLVRDKPSRALNRHERRHLKKLNRAIAKRGKVG